jgi:hypothetical protein
MTRRPETPTEQEAFERALHPEVRPRPIGPGDGHSKTGTESTVCMIVRRLQDRFSGMSRDGHSRLQRSGGHRGPRS